MKFNKKIFILIFSLMEIVVAWPARQADQSSSTNNILFNNNEYEKIDNNEKYSINNDDGNIDSEDYHVAIPMQNVGLEEYEEEERMDYGQKNQMNYGDDLRELLQTSENIFYEYHPPYLRPNYPAIPYQPNYLHDDLQQFYYRIDESPRFYTIFSLESVPHPSPLVWIIQPNSYYQHVSIPMQSIKTFSFPAVESIESNFGITTVPDFLQHFNGCSNEKEFRSSVDENGMSDENENSPKIVNNNQNDLEDIQNNIQVNSEDTTPYNDNLEATTNDPSVTIEPVTTTEFPSTETSTTLMDTTTTMDDNEDRIDLTLIKSLAGK